MRKLIATLLIVLCASSVLANDFPDHRGYSKPTDAASLTFDCTAYKGFYPTILTTATSVTLSNLQVDLPFIMEFQQASSGGPYAVTFTNTIKWQGGTTYVMTTTASKKDLVQCVKDPGGDLLCTPLQTF